MLKLFTAKNFGQNGRITGDKIAAKKAIKSDEELAMNFGPFHQLFMAI
jgi:hypothetical protein